jgi:hypothetical protein
MLNRRDAESAERNAEKTSCSLRSLHELSAALRFEEVRARRRQRFCGLAPRDN